MNPSWALIGLPPPDNLLVRIHFIIVMIRWTGLAPWESEFPFPDSLTFTFLGQVSAQRTSERIFNNPYVDNPHTLRKGIL